MKLSDDNLEKRKLAIGQYGFSATKIGDLGAAEYTLVTIVQDVSGSVEPFKTRMEDCLKSVLHACKFSERCDNLLVRFTQFNAKVSETHGFKLLGSCNVDDYTNCLTIGGSTALYDAAENGVRATSTYGRELIANEFSANAIVIFITDGDDNASTFSPKQVKEALKDAVSQETLESLVSILIGVNIQDPHMGTRLAEFRAEAGIGQYVEIDNAEAKTLAKLAAFISKSISSQSKALGSGAASQPINPTI